MKKRLIIGSIPDNYNPYIDIPLKPSCFLGKEHLYSDLHNLDFINAIDDKKDYPFFDKLANDEALRMVRVVATHFYQDEYEKFSFKFWKSIFYPWLSLLIPYIYREQLLVKKAVERYQNDEIEVYLFNRESILLDFSSVPDMIENGLRNIKFNGYILSLLIKQLAPKNWQLNYYPTNLLPGVRKAENRNRSIKQFIFNSIDSWLYRAKTTYGFSFIERVLLHYTLALKKPIVKSDNHNNQTSVREIDWEIDINKLVVSLVPDNLKEIDLFFKPRRYKKGKCVSYSNQLYTGSSIDAAFAYETGEIVIADQHGGHLYGSAITSESVYNIEFSSDLFLSWGWRKYNNKWLNNIIPLPSPLLSKLNNKHKGTSKDIIFVGTSMNLLNNHFNSSMSDLEIVKYRLNKVKLIGAYKREFGLQNIKYRPYNENSFSLEDSQFLLRQYPELILSKSKNRDFHKELKLARGIILDHPGTTLNIAMSVNIPILLFWERNWFPFNEESELFLNEFKKLGVYHEDPVSLIGMLKQIDKTHKNITTWWTQKEIQELRLKWLNLYALNDINWKKNWFLTLWKLK